MDASRRGSRLLRSKRQLGRWYVLVAGVDEGTEMSTETTDFSVFEWPTPRSTWLANLKDGEPCDHPGCLSHVTHPCEVCGRIAGRHPENTKATS